MPTCDSRLLKKRRYRQRLRLARQNVALYIFLLPTLLYFFVFCYMPMYGAQIAFRDFNFVNGIWGSKWVGLKWFQYFIKSPVARGALYNTLIINFYRLVTEFPIPIVLALIMHNLPNAKVRRVMQTITYMPHFISMVVLVSMLSCFFSMNSGFVNRLIVRLGGTQKQFMGLAEYFRHMFVWSGVWQSMGWGSIIYMAALSGVNSELHESAMIDGAGKLQRIWHVDLPSILPTIVIMLILQVGSIMNLDFEKPYLMQNDMNISVSEMLSTYNYKQGIVKTRYSYSASIGLFTNVVNLTMLLLVNACSRKFTETSLW